MALSLAIVAWKRSVYLPMIEESHRFDWRAKTPERKNAKDTDSRTRCMAIWRESRGRLSPDARLRSGSLWAERSFVEEVLESMSSSECASFIVGFDKDC